MGNSRGTTLAELLVAMGLTSLLLLIIIAGVIFMQRSIGRWLNDSRHAADLAIVGETFSTHLASARYVLGFQDSLVVVRSTGGRHAIGWSQHTLSMDGRPVLGQDVTTTQVTVRQFSLKTTRQHPIFITEQSSYAELSGLYQIDISWTDSAHYGTIQARFVAEATDRFLATRLAPRTVDSLGFLPY